MDALPVWAQLLILLALLIASGFFSISEISMMAMNRYRLKNLVRKGSRAARRTNRLLDNTENLLGTILIGNNVVNAALTALVTALAIRYFGNNDTVVLITTALIAVLIILFCEIGPKVVGANSPEKVALPASSILTALMWLLRPLVWAANRVVLGVLKWFGIDPSENRDNALSVEELRGVVAESSNLVPSKHRSILMNLFDLENITVDDVMIPRMRIEALDLADDEQLLREQLKTCYHNKLPVYEGEINKIIGILHVRRALSLLQRESFSSDDIREFLTKPYFVPIGTPVFKQLQFFQEQNMRFGLVVDEYGELQGLVTLADIIEEFVGEITSTGPMRDGGPAWKNGSARVDGSTPLRELNRRLNIALPMKGPKTLNGLILETLEELPEADVSIRFDTVAVEVVHIEGRTIRTVDLHKIAPLNPDTETEDESTT